MLNLQKLTIDLSVEELRKAYERTYSNIDQQLGNIIVWSGRLALENIANSDALYHNVEHTVMVTLAGQTIIEGKHLLEGGVAPRDWVHCMMAVLCHDIGYVRGICSGDKDGMVATGVGDETVEVPPGASDAVLSPYHVDRSKLFVRERFGKGLLMGMVTNIDAELIASYIEMTRFPVPDDDWYKDTKGYPGLVRASDFVGQLGDPNRPRESPALFVLSSHLHGSFHQLEGFGVVAAVKGNMGGDLQKLRILRLFCKGLLNQRPDLFYVPAFKLGC